MAIKPLSPEAIKEKMLVESTGKKWNPHTRLGKQAVSAIKAGDLELPPEASDAAIQMTKHYDYDPIRALVDIATDTDATLNQQVQVCKMLLPYFHPAQRPKNDVIPDNTIHISINSFKTDEKSQTVDVTPALSAP